MKVFSLGKERGRVSRVRYAWRFWKILIFGQFSYDTVFVHMNPEYVMLGGLFWRLTGKKFALWYEHKNITIPLRLATLLVTHVFSASEKGFRIKTKKLRVMGHGIDTTRAVPTHIPSPGTLRLMTSGRISAIKKLEVTLNAYFSLKARGLSVTYKIAGAPVSEEDKEYEEKLFELLLTHKEEKEEIFVGAIPHADMPKFRASADYFLHASETGSLDKTVLDAIISGVLPISASSAYQTLFGNYQGALSYPPGDHEALADRVLGLEALTPETRNAIRNALRERVVKEHSIESLIPRIVKELSHV